jgi:ABC-type transporter Mla subunit MlaD
MDKDIESILATVNFIKDRMLTKDEGATKDDLQQFERHLDARFDTLESRVGNIEPELRDIRQRLETLDEAAGNASGFAKENDHLLKRLAAIEKHLGLQTHIKA